MTPYPGPPAKAAACLQRCYAFTGLYSPEAIAATLNRATNFDDVRTGIEGGMHGAVHLQAGG